MCLQSYIWNVTNLFGPAQSSPVGHLRALDLGLYLLLTWRGPKILRWGTRSRYLIEVELAQSSGEARAKVKVRTHLGG